MGFFGSSKSHIEKVEACCLAVGTACATARHHCDESLRGKHEYMSPEQRADLLREALSLVLKARGSLQDAREKKLAMEQDQCPTEDLLAGESKLVAAQLDLAAADQAVREARNSLLGGMAEIEQFYGARSKEAKHLRKVLSDLEVVG